MKEKVKAERDIYSFLTHKFLSSIKILNVNVEIYVIFFLTLKIVVSSCSEMRNHEKQGFSADFKMVSTSTYSAILIHMPPLSLACMPNPM